MPPYRYRPGPYRYRAPWRYRYGAAPPALVVVVLAVAALALGTRHGHAPADDLSAARPESRAAEVAISFAERQVGKPYTWGGTGPDGYDCSGLVMQAYAAAGITIPRTSQEQWATMPHIPASEVRPGDLVFFAGSDGTWQAPGHVALVTGPHEVIQAYETGTVIMRATFGLPGSLGGIGEGDVIGYAAPSAVLTAARRSPGRPFAAAFLRAAGVPASRCDLALVAAWTRAENTPPSWRNPLATTRRAPGSRSVNSAGVQAYPSWTEAVAATAATIRSGPYQGILSALSASDGQRTADAVSRSPWGTERFEVSC